MASVLCEKRGHQLWITLNRPEAKNMLDGPMFLELADAWQRARDDDDVRVVVLTASGSEDFCCGGDLAEVIPLWTGAKVAETDVEKRLQNDVHIADKIMLKDKPFYKPVIAAVNGRALGGGTELLQATDIRIAADHAIFSLPEPKVGIVPAAGSMVRLARQLPWAHAMKILLGGESVTATEALAMGLISEVVSGEELNTRAEYYAAKICLQAPLALQAIKRVALDTHTLPWEQAFQIEMEEATKVMMSEDAREGPRAFKQKRAAKFVGK